MFKQGELVRVRDDLIQEHRYTDNLEHTWTYVMKEFAGCVGHVTYADKRDNTYLLDVDNECYWYPAIFLEAVTDK